MLDKYRQQVQKLEKMKSDYSSKSNSITKLLYDKHAMEQKIDKLNADKHNKYSEVMQAEAQRRKDSFSPLLQEIRSINTLISQKESSMVDECKHIDLEPLHKKNQKLIKLIDRLEPTITLIISSDKNLEMTKEYPYKESYTWLLPYAKKLDSDEISVLLHDKIDKYFEAINKEEEEESMDLPRKVVGTIFNLPSRYNGNKFVKYGIYAGMAFGVGLLIINLYTALVAAGVFCSYKIYKSVTQKKKTLAVKDELVEFQSRYDSIQDYLSSSEQKYTEKKIKEIQDFYKQQIDDLHNEITDIQTEYDNSINGIVITREEIEKIVEEDFIKSEQAFKDSMEKITEKIKAEQEALDAMAKEITALHSELDIQRETIRESYMGLKNIGASKLMITDYILGFNEQLIISLKHNDKTMNIFYTGGDAENNSILINMMIAQCFGNMQPNVLRITIVDSDYSCRDYAIYNVKALESVFEFVTVDSNLNSLLETAHHEVMTRTATISQVANNIDEYNREKIEKESLTMDYHLIFFQNAPISLTENQLFLQICRTGPTFGIYPVVFLSKEARDAKLADRRNEKFLEYLNIVKDTSWTFNQRTLDLEQTKLRYKSGGR